MPSFTSSSEIERSTTFGRRGYAALLAVVSLLFAGVELASRYAFPRIDRGMRRNIAEVSAALRVRKQADGLKRVIVVGNSLLDNGVRFDDAARSLRPEIDAARVMVPDTNYYDWYYGLRKLLAGGARPDTVVLMLSPRQLVADRIRGDYSACHMFLTSDVFRAARRLNLPNTETSNLMFANFSAYFGDGGEIRKGIVRRTIPSLPALMALMTHTEAPPLVADDVFKTATNRLKELRELAAEWNTRIVLVVPPSGEPKCDTAYNEVQLAGVAAGVQVVVPVAAGSIPGSFYSDGFHLNPRGAALFTPRFVEAVRKAVSEQ